MPVTNWNTATIDGKQYLVIDAAQFRVPLDWDPSSNVFIAVAAPSGGLGNFPALVRGDPGVHAELAEQINLTALEPDDPTPDSASFTVLTPPTDTTPGLYKLNLTLHKGPAGQDGTTTLDVNAYGTPQPKKFLVVNSASDGFEYQTQKVGDIYVPGQLNNTVTGNPMSTLGVVSLGPYDFDWRPIPTGQTIISPTGSNIRVDLIARLNGEANGNPIARTFGIAGSGAGSPGSERLHLDPTPPAGAADSYNRVAAGQQATVHLRAERQSGTDTFSTSRSTTTFGVKVSPIP